MASNNNFVDLSADNDNAVITNSSSTTNTSGDQFERSCDNPECSAPRLIAKVPKQDTFEFITEPKVIAKPTIINGFTTVFRVDGKGTKMEELMNEYTDAEKNLPPGQVHKPKTVFRVVPNTHAHIVNYVVVESASDTLKKIKENDPETIRKLLVSQRLSAEQMLKKLIGKALETPTRVDRPTSIMAPTPAAPTLPNPIIAPVPSLTTTQTEKPSPPENTAVPTIATPKANSVLTSPMPATLAINSPPRIPSCLTVRVIPNPDANKTVSETPSKPIAASQAVATNESTPRPSRTVSASKPVVWQAVTPGTAGNKTSSLNQTISPGSTQPVVTSPANTSESSIPPAIPKALIQNPSSKVSPNPLSSASENPVSKTIHNIKYTTEPNKAQLADFKRKYPESTPQTPELGKRPRRNPNRVHSMTPFADASILAKSKNILPPSPNRTLPTLPKDLKSQSALGKTRNVVPIKGLIIPKPIEELANPASLKKDTGKKPTQALPVQPVVPSPSTAVTPSPSAVVTPSIVTSPPPPATATPSTATPTRKKNKPLMGPASKMRALKAMAEAKKQELKKNESMSIFQSGPVKIGDTFITKTIVPKVGKTVTQIPPDSPQTTPNADQGETLTKPCSVAITDIVKSSTTTDSDSESIKTKSSTRSCSKLPFKSTSEIHEERQKANQTLMDKYRGRLTLKRVPDKKSTAVVSRTTRSAAAAKPIAEDAAGAETVVDVEDNLSDSTLLTSPSAPSRVLRVVLPSQKNGVVNNPPTSPHPNLKISSVISGGAPLAANLQDETIPVIVSEDSMDNGIEQLQKELADLRRTVARLTQGKKT